MGNIGQVMPGAIPAVGEAGPTYATDLNTFLTEVKVRLEEEIPFSSFLPGTLDMSNNPVINIEYLGLFASVSSPSSPTNTLQQFGGDLYWVSPSGAVQITSGATLDASSVGGITGDYGGSNPAQFRYVTANTEYTAYTNFSAGTYAFLWCLGLDLASATTGSNRIRLVSSGTSNYTLTLPTALPGTQSPVYLSSGGALSTISTRSYTLVVGASSAEAQQVSTTHTFSNQNNWTLASTSNTLVYSINLPVGVTITAWTLYLKKNTSGTTTLTAQLRKFIHDASTDQTAQTNNANAPGFITLGQTGLSLTTATTEQYIVFLTNTSGTAGDLSYQLEVTYTATL